MNSSSRTQNRAQAITDERHPVTLWSSFLMLWRPLHRA